MKRVNINLTEGQIKKLKDMATNTGLSYAEIVRRVLDEHLGEVRVTKTAPAN